MYTQRKQTDCKYARSSETVGGAHLSDADDTTVEGSLFHTDLG